MYNATTKDAETGKSQPSLLGNFEPSERSHLKKEKEGKDKLRSVCSLSTSMHSLE